MLAVDALWQGFAVPKSMCFVKIPTAQAELLVNAVTFNSFAADMVKNAYPILFQDSQKYFWSMYKAKSIINYLVYQPLKVQI